MRRETAFGEEYLNLRIFRFYFRCPNCLAEITFKANERCNLRSALFLGISTEAVFRSDRPGELRLSARAWGDATVRSGEAASEAGRGTGEEGGGREERPDEDAREADENESRRDGGAR